MSLPGNVAIALSDPTFHRRVDDTETALVQLGVSPSSEFREFYKTYIGPFWSESLGIELAEMVDEDFNIKTFTDQCRSQFGFPKQLLVLTPLSAGATVHVLDTESDEVFVVDFEGGEALLLKGELQPRWASFREFLQDYF